MNGSVAELEKQLRSLQPETFSFGREFLTRMRDELGYGQPEEIEDDMMAPFPGLAIAPSGVVP